MSIFDNRLRQKAFDFLHAELTSNAYCSFVSAYFTIFGYEALAEKLNGVRQTRFLFGDPEFVKSIDPTKTASKNFSLGNDGITLENTLHQRQTAQSCADWIRQSVEIRSVKHGSVLLHGKMYHIKHEGGRDAAMLGSSNFTASGLGLTKSPNIELNMRINDDRDRDALLEWFNELWHDDNATEDVKASVLEYLARIYADKSPDIIYLKTLFHLFEEWLKDGGDKDLLQLNPAFSQTHIWKQMAEFQRDAVRGAVRRLMTLNGCILADSVGLGKTFTALGVIKYFELKNERVLVLAPKRLRENWTLFKNNTKQNPLLGDNFRYDVLSHTDLSRSDGRTGDIDLATLHWENYDLIVIDESHNFRNNTKGRKDEEGNTIQKTRYERLMQDVIQRGINTKVLLLSATPVNNNLPDIRNQIDFITKADKHAFRETLNIADYHQTFKIAQGHFTLWQKQKERNKSELMSKLGADFIGLMDALTIARNRRHVADYYQADVSRFGVFPKHAKPITLAPPLDSNKRSPSYKRINDEINLLSLALYQPAQYLKPDAVAKYDRSTVKNFTQAKREGLLIGMMRTNFLKRLESSVHSFGATLERTVEKVEDVLQRIEQYQKGNVLDFNSADADTNDDDETKDAFVIGKKISYNLADMRLDEWKKKLETDKDILVSLLDSAQAVSVKRDAKLAELKAVIKDKLKKPTTNADGTPNRKLLVFTAFADTATYLYDSLAEEIRALGFHAAVVTGAGANNTTLGKTDFNDVLMNFSPISKLRAGVENMPQDGEIDILFATDCISEGQNLQDCDTVINYDIHWNPVRIIQRFGRIDRIGSRASKVQMINFFPTSELDEYLNLKNRVVARMALVDIAGAGDSDIFSEEEITAELRYRDKQIERLKNEEMIDLDGDDSNGDDIGGGISLVDFSLDSFRMDLQRFLDSSRRELEEMPFGCYAVVQAQPDKHIPSGVLALLKHKQANAHNPEPNAGKNPLAPYFLVYMREDGTAHFGWTSIKRSLQAFAELCNGVTAPIEKLCREFDRETGDGKDMSKYNTILQAACRSITDETLQRSAAAVTQGGLFPKKSQLPQTENDFELVTWLVVK